MANVESDYLFVEVAAQRCVQLMRGAKPKLEEPARKFTTLAIREVDEGLIDYRIGEDTSEEGEEAEASDADESVAEGEEAE